MSGLKGYFSFPVTFNRELKISRQVAVQDSQLRKLKPWVGLPQVRGGISFRGGELGERNNDTILNS